MRRGQGMCEYLIVLGVIAAAAALTVWLFGRQVREQFEDLRRQSPPAAEQSVRT